jgi:hypothetical protein
MTETEKHGLVQRSLGVATLDGHPAQVVGYQCAFATVQRLDGANSFLWSWPTVERILDRDGRFRS